MNDPTLPLLSCILAVALASSVVALGSGAPSSAEHPATIVVGSIPVGMDPSSIAYGGHGDLYVTDQGSNETSIISGASQSVIGEVPISGIPVSIAFDNASGALYEDFYNQSGYNYMAEINGTSNLVVHNITVGPGGVFGVAYDSMNHFVYENVGGNVSVVDTLTSTRIFQLQPTGVDLAFDPSNGHLYDTGGRPSGDFSPGEVLVFNGSGTSRPTSAPSSVFVGAGALGIVVDSGTNTIYVDTYIPGNLSGNVSTISGASDTVTGSVEVGANPTGIAVDPESGNVLVTCYSSPTSAGNVTFIDPASGMVVGSIPVGLAPVAIAIDNVNGYAYVVNSGSDSVSYFPLGFASPSAPSPTPFPVIIVPVVGAAAVGFGALAIWIWKHKPHNLPPS